MRPDGTDPCEGYLYIFDKFNEVCAERDRLRQALTDVVNPLGALKRHADAQGGRLNEMAHSVANNLGYVQDIAKRALSPSE